MLKHRLIYGPIMIAALVLIFYLDNQLDRVELRTLGQPWSGLFSGRSHLPAGLLMLLAFLLLIIPGTRELTAIFRAKSLDAQPLITALAGMLGCLLFYALPYQLDSQVAVAIFGSVLVLVFVGSLVQYSWTHRRTQGAVAVGAVTLFALIYMGVLPGFLIAIRRWYSAWVIAAILLVIKSCDIGAYFTGRAIGRHKLIPWLSPGKTWEGLAGGVVFSALVAGGLALLNEKLQLAGRYNWESGSPVFEPHHFHLVRSMAAGALLGLVGHLGDLIASLFKRDAGLKDSGASIPGFGGLIDVVDSPLIAAPLAYWLLAMGKLFG